MLIIYNWKKFINENIHSDFKMDARHPVQTMKDVAQNVSNKISETVFSKETRVNRLVKYIAS